MECQDFPLKCFCLTVSKNSVGESFTVALFWGTERVWIRAGCRVVSKFSVEKFLSHSAEKIRKGIFYCCLTFGYRKSLYKGGGYQDFVSRFFRRTVPNFSVGESFNVALISDIEKVWIGAGGSIKIFRRKFFASQR